MNAPQLKYSNNINSIIFNIIIHSTYTYYFSLLVYQTLFFNIFEVFNIYVLFCLNARLAGNKPQEKQLRMVHLIYFNLFDILLVLLLLLLIMLLNIKILSLNIGFNNTIKF